MISASFRLTHRPAFQSFRLVCLFGIALAAMFVSGCGGGNGSGSTLSGNTSVVVLVSSTANDQISHLYLTLASLTLTSQSGKTITVFSTPQNAELMHLNGTAEPLATVMVPQDVYTSATAAFEVAEPSNAPLCVGQNTAAEENLFNQQIQLSLNPTVSVPSPITVTGAAMGLALDLAVSPVQPFNCTFTSGTNSVAATFSLTPVTIAASPTNSTNGKATSLRGLINTVTANGASFSVAGADGPSWQVSTGSNTVFQGITGASELAAGIPVDMDVAIQMDGSLLATRVAVYDPNPANLTISSGPLVERPASVPVVLAIGVEGQGLIPTDVIENFSFGATTFQISGQLTNLQSLPFAASFNASNMVPGQNILFSTHALSVQGGPTYAPATTATLVPQTINGTVSAVSMSGGFTTYTVTLAPYDLFPDFAAQPGQTTLLSNPNTVIVYADSNTQLLNSKPIAAGSIIRFNGLVFNDNGTLSMDCAQINDGVAE
jgi:hypothetical protein